MPVYSMTGYASGQSGPSGNTSDTDSKPGSGRLGIEIRSVNSRFLDLTFKLGDELRQHEPALRELLTRRLKRGKVELRASIESSGNSGIGDPSTRLLQRLNGLQDGIKAWLPGARELSVADVLRLAGGDGPSSGDLSAYSFHMADMGTDSMDREKAFLAASAEGRNLIEVDEAALVRLTGELARIQLPGFQLAFGPLRAVKLGESDDDA